MVSLSDSALQTAQPDFSIGRHTEKFEALPTNIHLCKANVVIFKLPVSPVTFPNESYPGPWSCYTSYLLCSGSLQILTQRHISGQVAQMSRNKSGKTQFPGFGTLDSGNCVGSANASIVATLGAQTPGRPRVSEAGARPSQPGRGMTQHERDDLLGGVGSQFDNIGPTSGASTTGYGYRL